MKKTIFLVIILILLIGLSSYFFILIKKQSLNDFGLKNISQVFQNKNNLHNNNQVNQANFNQSATPTTKTVSQGITLEISEPKANAFYNTSSIKVSGKTSAYAEVYVNDIQTKADGMGNFSVNYNLDEGENLLTIVANDQAGNYAEKEMTVFLQTQE